jgi:DNA-binding response OmpR family regulator
MHAPLDGAAPRLSVERCFLRAPDKGAGSVIEKRPYRILIIEDDLLIAADMELALADAGFDPIGIAPTGEEAIEMARTQLPDLAVVDIRLAGNRDGVDTALELFREHGIRCIFATAFSDREARRRAAEAEPLGWLQKPYTMTSLTDLVLAAAGQLRSRTDN